MKRIVFALASVAVLAAASVGIVAFALAPEAGPGSDMAHADHAAHGAGPAGDHGTHHAADHGTSHAADHGAMSHDLPGRPAIYDTGMHRPPFPAPEGKVPTASDARDMRQVNSINLRSDEALAKSSLVQGNGTFEDPYVIERLYVTGSVNLQDTDACIVLRELYVGGTLRLNWNDGCIHLHHSYVRDLRVNENIRRTGMPTGGFIEHNEFGHVGQIRHFDGIFAHNTVGPRPQGVFDEIIGTVAYPFVQDPRALNADGWHQAVFHANTIHGSVDLKLHGHHHGDAFDSDHSHYHGSDDGTQREHDHHDHADRWHSVYFIGNTIIDPDGYGLRYTDRQHRADDRTATSERNDELNGPHQHHTYVVIADNVVEGSPIWIDVFNQDDRDHPERNPGWLFLRGNTVFLDERAPDGPLDIWGPAWNPYSAIRVHSVKEVETVVADNRVVFRPADRSDEDAVTALTGHLLHHAPPTAGIELNGVRGAEIDVGGNVVEGFDHGVRAERLDEGTTWRVLGNTFKDVKVEIHTDRTVQSDPETD